MPQTTLRAEETSRQPRLHALKQALRHNYRLNFQSAILTLDPKTGKMSTLIDGIGTPDGVAIDRQGNLFIAADIGVLELNTNNQLLIVGTNTSSVAWDDVAPLSGSGAASY